MIHNDDMLTAIGSILENYECELFSSDGNYLECYIRNICQDSPDHAYDWGGCLDHHVKNIKFNESGRPRVVSNDSANFSNFLLDLKNTLDGHVTDGFKPIILIRVFHSTLEVCKDASFIPLGMMETTLIGW